MDRHDEVLKVYGRGQNGYVFVERTNVFCQEEEEGSGPTGFPLFIIGRNT
jgi:hypothetical protein